MGAAWCFCCHTVPSRTHHRTCLQANQSQILALLPFFSKMAQHLGLRCVLISAPGTVGAGAKPRRECRIKKFTPRCIYATLYLRHTVFAGHCMQERVAVLRILHHLWGLVFDDGEVVANDTSRCLTAVLFGTYGYAAVRTTHDDVSAVLSPFLQAALHTDDLAAVCVAIAGFVNVNPCGPPPLSSYRDWVSHLHTHQRQALQRWGLLAIVEHALTHAEHGTAGTQSAAVAGHTDRHANIPVRLQSEARPVATPDNPLCLRLCIARPATTPIVCELSAANKTNLSALLKNTAHGLDGWHSALHDANSHWGASRVVTREFGDQFVADVCATNLNPAWRPADMFKSLPFVAKHKFAACGIDVMDAEYIVRERVLHLNSEQLFETTLTADLTDEHMRAALLMDSKQVLRRSQEQGITVGSFAVAQMEAWYGSKGKHLLELVFSALSAETFLHGAIDDGEYAAAGSFLQQHPKLAQLKYKGVLPIHTLIRKLSWSQEHTGFDEDTEEIFVPPILASGMQLLDQLIDAYPDSLMTRSDLNHSLGAADGYLPMQFAVALMAGRVLAGHAKDLHTGTAFINVALLWVLDSRSSLALDQPGPRSLEFGWTARQEMTKHRETFQGAHFAFDATAPAVPTVPLQKYADDLDGINYGQGWSHAEFLGLLNADYRAQLFGEGFFDLSDAMQEALVQVASLIRRYDCINSPARVSAEGAAGETGEAVLLDILTHLG